MKSSTNDYGVKSLKKQLKTAKKVYKLADARDSGKFNLIFTFWLNLLAYTYFCGLLIELWNDSIAILLCLVVISFMLYQVTDSFKKKNLLDKYGPGNENEITTLDNENEK